MTIDFFQEISADVTNLILEHLDPTSTVNLYQTCKFFKLITGQNLIILNAIYSLNYDDGINQLLTSNEFINLITTYPAKISFIIDNIFMKKRFDGILDFSQNERKDWTPDSLKKSLNELASHLNGRSYETLLLQMIKRFKEVALVQKSQQEEYRWNNPPVILTSTASVKNLSKDYIGVIHSLIDEISDQHINTSSFSA